MIPDEYRDFFVAAVGAAGALVGLLFVAISVSPHRDEEEMSTMFELEASSALIAFTHVLTLSLLALIPGINLGYAAVTLAVLGLAFSAGAVRILQAGRQHRYGIPFGLAVIAALDMWGGIRLLINPRTSGGVDLIAGVIVASLLFGVSRAWQLVGLHSNSLLRSLRIALRGPNGRAGR